MASVTLETLHFDNLALRRLPLDPEQKSYVRTVNGACFSRVKPTPVRNPKLVAYSQSAMALLDLPESELKRSEFVEYFSGNKLLPGSDPAAHCYCGHQFGYFAGQLGDGAAMYLGEVLNQRGERWEIQLKGAGLTPYSRQADGRKVLRSSIREFLCSEAMHHLGIPTTRAGSCITSDTKVTRDIFYNGNQKEERCTIVLRIAPTFLRFGSFEIFNTRDKSTGRCGPSVGRTDILQKLLDYAIETFFPQIYAQHHENLQEMYKEFFKEVVLRTARLVSQWQCVGFCHGVLNTDNMSILGLTIDYGPFGFMDRYDPDHVCNASDDGGRYTYIKQPEICLWNLKKLAEALKQVVPLEETTPLLDLFNEEYQKCYLDKMRKKLGLISKQLDDDLHLVESLLETMELTGSDFTNSFRSLSSMKLPGLPGYEQSKKDLEDVLVKNCADLEEMIKANKTNMDPRQFYLFLTLMQTNPDLLEQLGKGPVAMARVIARIERGKKLKEMTPEMKQEEDVNAWKSWLDKYSERLKLEAEEIQDEALAAHQEERVRVMNSNNPRIILRNYLAENAISNAEKGDFTEVWRLLEALQHPYDDATHALESQADKGSVATCSSFVDEYTRAPPEWALDLRVT